MANFFIIDQSLARDGTHHADYMRLVAQAASKQTYKTYVGSHVSYATSDLLASVGAVRAAFRDTTYSKYSRLAGVRELAGSKPIDFSPVSQGLFGKWKRIRQKSNHRFESKRREKHIRRFAQDCKTFFDGHSFTDSDHAFFVTMSDIDFAGLAAYLAATPETMPVNWHVQFHFNPLAGRPHEFASQRHLARAIGLSFRQAFAKVPYHHIHCYATTDELTRQYADMTDTPFQHLPYPIEPQLKFDTPDVALPQPLRFTVAGGVRREKGQKSNVGQLIGDLWSRYLAPNKIQLNIQGKKSAWLSKQRTLPDSVRDSVSNDVYNQSVVLHPHPLPEPDYVQLIQNSHAGLFFYDGLRYYGRRAGILGEFLAAGKPVIVPAGSWLSEQIAEPSFCYLEELIAGHRSVATQPITETKWSSENAPLTGGVISFDKSKHPFALSFQPTEKQHAFMFSFKWNWALDTSEHTRIEARYWGDDNRLLRTDSQIVGVRCGGGPSLALFNRAPGTKRVDITFRNAFASSSLSLAGVTLHLLDGEQNESLPRSAVGIAIESASQMAFAIDELVAHYPHFRNTADDFSEHWAARHDPHETLTSLTHPTKPMQRVA